MNQNFECFKISLLKANQSKAFFNLINSNRAHLEDYFSGTVSKTKTLNDTINYCKLIEQRINDKSYFPFMISDKESKAFIGLVDVKNIDWNIPKAELGFFIDSEFKRKGITSKATALVINYLIKTYHFKKLLCRANSRNLGSISVILKNEFQLEGTIRNDYITSKGEIVDLNYYGRIF